MQTTLLGAAIALILALVSALVAPLVVDWNRYRATFEAEASGLTGLNVRVNGTIQVRLLPSPEITVRDVEFAGSGAEPSMRAGTLKLELALGPLLRGKVHASTVDVIAPQIQLGFDKTGAVQWPRLPPAFDPGALSIAHLNVQDGQVILDDAVSGKRLEAHKLYFDGSVASFAGSFRGEGALVVGDNLYGYRIAGTRPGGGSSSGSKVHLSVEPANYPLTAELDGLLVPENGVPQFDGTFALARPVGATLANGRRVVNAPWRATGKLHATPAVAALREIAFRYGPEDRAVNFTGRADLFLGAQPRLDGEANALQVDVERALADPDLSGRPPLALVKSFLQAFAGEMRPPVPVRVALGVEAIGLGGAVVEGIHGQLGFDGTGWTLNDFSFRLPGPTSVKLSGRLATTSQGFAFSGPAAMQSADANALLAWLSATDKDKSPSAIRAMTARGDLTIATDRIAVEHMAGTLDRDALEGRLAYRWPLGNRPGRVDVELRAANLDLDALAPFAAAAAADAGLAVPQEGALSLNIGRASYGGIDAKAIDAQLKFDAGKLQIDRLSVGDLGGAQMAIGGRIDELSSQPQGQITLDLDARSLDGIADIVARFAPTLADTLHRDAGRLAPAKINAVLKVTRAAAAVGKPTSVPGSAAELHLTGSLAAMRLVVDTRSSGEAAHPGNAVTQLDARLDAADGNSLIALFGLDRFIGVDRLPGRMTLTASGALAGTMQVEAKLAASGLSSAVAGTVHLNGQRTAGLRLQLAAGDLGPWRQAITGRAGSGPSASARAGLDIVGDRLSLTGLDGKIGATAVRGRLNFNLADPASINGELAADDVDAADALALLIGAPGKDRQPPGAWSAQSFGPGLFAPLEGAVTIKLGHVGFTQALVAQDLTALVRFHPGGIAIDDVGGSLAGGRLAGSIAFRRDPEGVSADGHVEIDGAAADAILGPPLNARAGQTSMALQAHGFGAAPQALIGSLNGGGKLSLTNVQFAGLDPAAFTAAYQAVGHDAPIDTAKLQSVVHAVLANGRVTVAAGEVPLTLGAGVIALSQHSFPLQNGASLALQGALDLGASAVDARFTLSQAPPAYALIAVRPEISLSVKGPLPAAPRLPDIAGLTNWLTLNAAELQTRRIEMIEADRRLAGAGQSPHVDLPAPPDVPPGRNVEVPVPFGVLTAPISGAKALERLAAPPPAPLPGSGNLNRGGATNAAPNAGASNPNGAGEAMRPPRPSAPPAAAVGAGPNRSVGTLPAPLLLTPSE